MLLYCETVATTKLGLTQSPKVNMLGSDATAPLLVTLEFSPKSSLTDLLKKAMMPLS